MDAATVKARLQAEGIAVTVHHDGRLTAKLTKPRSESWGLWLRDRVRAIPGAIVVVTKERPAADPYFEHAEVLFRLGPAPESTPCVTTQPCRTEVPREVAKAEGAVIPARMCDSPGRRPGSLEGPGRVSPGGMVGREAGRAA